MPPGSITGPGGLRARLRATRSDESGWASPEWLVIMAAVATAVGLAALGVVVVQGVVSETAGQLETSSYRRTVAEVTAAEVVKQATNPATLDDSRWATWHKWEGYFSSKCARTAIAYADAVDAVEASFEAPTDVRGSDPLTYRVPTERADGAPAALAKPQAACRVL